ncbi:transgelin [Nematocida sp. AWRm80]|nr:transgelin [Nematocida sp. AWRm80]
MDRSSEIEILLWIKEILLLKIDENKDQLMDVLENGIILCNIINKFIPNKCSPVKSNLVFRKMENIEIFLKAAREIGVLESELFETIDLIDKEKQNPKQIAICLYSLSRNLKKKFPKSKYKVIGPVLAQQNKRVFTEEQLDMGNKIISIQMGSNKGATQAGLGTGNRQITPK